MAILGSAVGPQIGRKRIGGKAAGLNTMVQLGLPVLPAFVVPVHGAQPEREFVPPGSIRCELRNGIEALESATGRGFGRPTAPLLVSVWTGASGSTPGMIDTILNLGTNSDIASVLQGSWASPNSSQSDDPAVATFLSWVSESREGPTAEVRSALERAHVR